MSGTRTKFRCPACRVRDHFSLTWFNGHFYCPKCFTRRAANYVKAAEAFIAPIRVEGPTPFERQMQAVRNGAGISTVIPINRRVEPSYTLGGVSDL